MTLPSQAFGEPVAAFELRSLEGRRFDLRRAVDREQGCVLVFWSGICSHCRRYDDWLNHFSARYPQLALAVIACRQNEDATSIAVTARERGLQFDILLDLDRAVARAYRVEQTPRAFLVDRGLRLLYRGAIDNFKFPRDPEHVAYLDRAICDWLAGRPVARRETPSFGCPVESVYYQA